MTRPTTLPRLNGSQALVLSVLRPINGSETKPVLTRVQLAKSIGYSTKSGTVNRALNGIRKGSSSGKPYKGLLDLGMIEAFKVGGITKYRITPVGLTALKSHTKWPQQRNRVGCTNKRYLWKEPTGTDGRTGPIHTAPEAGMKPAKTDEAYPEGRVVLSLHRRKERNPKAVRRKKERVLAAHGKLLCEVCAFDFVVAYGSLGEGFAECHHRVPLEKLDGTTPTRLSDLAIVCANCHRMLHRRSSRSSAFHTVEQLRAIVQSRRVK